MGYNCPPGSACYQAQKLVNKYVPSAIPELKHYLDCIPQYDTVFNFPCSAITHCFSGCCINTNIANDNLEFDGHHSSALNSWHWDIRNTMGDSTTMLFKIDASTGIQFGNGDGFAPATGYEFPLQRGSAGQVLQLVNTATTVTTTPGELVWGEGSSVPLNFITNSSFFRNTASLPVLIGSSRLGYAGSNTIGGWNTSVDFTTLAGPSILPTDINVAIPIPLDIYSGTTGALNVCGNAFSTNSATSFTALTYLVTCDTTSPNIPILELGRTVETFGTNGVGCFNMDIDAPPQGLNKCSDSIIIGMRLGTSASYLQFSYKGTVEKVQPS